MDFQELLFVKKYKLKTAVKQWYALAFEVFFSYNGRREDLSIFLPSLICISKQIIKIYFVLYFNEVICVGLMLNELLCFDYFKGLRLIAGKKGLSATVSYCGILEYELDPKLNKKYSSTNFKPHTLAISSLYFARDNPFQILEAVKYLVAQGGSGLVIKNIFRLPIHESVLHYADYKDFPVLLMDDTVMFEDFIVQVYHCIDAVSDAVSAELLLDRLLYQDPGGSERVRTARQLFPSFRSQYLIVHIRAEGPLSGGKIAQIRESAAQYPKETVSAVFGYRGGALLILSQEEFPGTLDPLLDSVADVVSQIIPCPLGVSKVHFDLEDIDVAIREAMFSSTVHHLEHKYFQSRRAHYIQYGQLGVYQVLLPVLGDPALPQYSHQILEPVIGFDAENRGNLMETLLMLVQCGGDLRQSAQEMGQHENTLRYRLNKVFTLTGLNYQRPAHYEKLALAVRIYLLSQEDPPF